MSPTEQQTRNSACDGICRSKTFPFLSRNHFESPHSNITLTSYSTLQFHVLIIIKRWCCIFFLSYDVCRK